MEREMNDKEHFWKSLSEPLPWCVASRVNQIMMKPIALMNTHVRPLSAVITIKKQKAWIVTDGIGTPIFLFGNGMVSMLKE